jgi:hypothetical protein
MPSIADAWRIDTHAALDRRLFTLPGYYYFSREPIRFAAMIRLTEYRPD